MTKEQAEAMQKLEREAEERRKAAESQAQNTTAASADFDFPAPEAPTQSKPPVAQFEEIKIDEPKPLTDMTGSGGPSETDILVAKIKAQREAEKNKPKPKKAEIPPPSDLPQIGGGSRLGGLPSF